MIIKQLILHNFGVYAGDNTFDFSCEKPIVLIGGMNGRGKTTFLEAILLALYGSNSAGYKESKYKSYGSYLRSYVNKNNRDGSSFVELTFETNESLNNEYKIRREWDALSRRTTDRVTAYENGKYSDFHTRNWPMFVENILPSELSRFFFFDGEKIAELAVDDTKEQMKESIRSMLGISVLDVLKKDLVRTAKKETSGSSEDDSVEKINALRENKEKLESAYSDVRSELALAVEEAEKQRENIERLHNQYEIKGGDVLEQRQSLIQRRSDLLAEIEQNRNVLLECAASELPLSLVIDLIGRIKLQAEDEHNDMIMQQALDMIREMMSDYNETNPEHSEANRQFIDYVQKMTDEMSTENVYQVSDYALFQLNSLLENLLDQSKERTLTALRKKKALQRDLDEVDSYLSLDINEKAMSDLLNNIRQQEERLVQLEVRAASLEVEERAANQALIQATAEHRKVVEQYLQQVELLDRAERITKYTNIALAIADSFSIEMQKKKSDTLGKTITACYKQLANKRNLICNIVMDPETLDIIYLDEQNKVVEKESLSAGEKQLMVIAILWALAICSRKKLPVIIDTPLSRLDSLHREAMVKTYFPQASDQTIILSTDSEINREYYEMMKEYIGDEFTLIYDEETKSTTIMKGYLLRQ